jgi:molecular chaperone GrpE
MRRRVKRESVRNGRPSDDGTELREAEEMEATEAAGESEDRTDRGSSSTEPTTQDLSGAAPASGDSDTDLLMKELESLKDRHLRLAAEFDNYRKRSQHQLGESSARAQAYLASEIITVLDDFDRVTSIDPESATVESLVEGINLVKRKMRQVLEGAGLEEVDPAGERFDPNTMEAVLRVPTSSAEEDDTVAQVFQRGYRFRGQLLRPARVSVRKSE